MSISMGGLPSSYLTFGMTPRKPSKQQLVKRAENNATRPELIARLEHAILNPPQLDPKKPKWMVDKLQTQLKQRVSLLEKLQGSPSPPSSRSSSPAQKPQSQQNQASTLSTSTGVLHPTLPVASSSSNPFVSSSSHQINPHQVKAPNLHLFDRSENSFVIKEGSNSKHPPLLWDS
jgi:hypothetical protein